MKIKRHEDQTQAIAAVAHELGCRSAGPMVDAGKSGLTVQRAAGAAGFARRSRGGAALSAVLVYDPSRGGRFQNPKEAGYHIDVLGLQDLMEVLSALHPAETAPVDGRYIRGWFRIEHSGQFIVVSWSAELGVWVDLLGERLPQDLRLSSWGGL